MMTTTILTILLTALTLGGGAQTSAGINPVQHSEARGINPVQHSEAAPPQEDPATQSRGINPVQHSE